MRPDSARELLVCVVKAVGGAPDVCAIAHYDERLAHPDKIIFLIVAFIIAGAHRSISIT